MIGLLTGTSMTAPVVLSAQGGGLALIQSADVITASTVIL